MRSGVARSIPPADITATVQLAGQSATVDAHLAAGRANLAVTGRAPLGAGSLALHAAGGLDLAMLDPILAADGRRARGHVALDGRDCRQPWPRRMVTGGITLTGGEVQDFTQGVHLTDLAATLQGAGHTIPQSPA